MRIAYLSPLRPMPTGIADYSEELLPYLARHMQVDLIVDGYEPSNPQIRDLFPVYDITEFAARQQRWPYDLLLYHMGNHPSHLYIYRTLQQYPGVVVLHDAVLHHFLLGTVLEQEKAVEEYRTAFGEPTANSLLRRRMAGLWSEVDHFVFPGLCQVVGKSRAILVHSQAARRRVQQIAADVPVYAVPLHTGVDHSPCRGMSPSQVKRRFGFPTDVLLIATFGFVTPTKRFAAVLAAYRSLLEEVPEARYLIVGHDNPYFDIRRLVRDMGLEGLVWITGPVSLETFCGLIDATDIAVQLRYPSAGEMSAALLRVMGKGTPVLVSNYAQFAEFPDDCCLKVDLGPAEVPMIRAYLKMLAEDPDLRRQIGENARRYVHTHHSIERAVQAYLEVLEQVADRERPAGRSAEDTTMEKPDLAWVDVPALMATIRRELARQLEAGELAPPDQERYQTVVADWLMEEIRLALAERWHAGELVGPDMGRYHVFDSPPEELDRHLKTLNETWERLYEPTPEVTKGKTPLVNNLWASMRQQVHKEVRAYLDPMIYRQSELNSAVISVLNILTQGFYGGSLARSLMALYREVAELRREVARLQEEVRALRQENGGKD